MFGLGVCWTLSEKSKPHQFKILYFILDSYLIKQYFPLAGPFDLSALFVENERWARSVALK
ncbi:MAG: hypothetical protein EBS66_13605 [Betaproteobacteria bacterium]|jgi:hypothetical protein|nr:hypothetical protein [Betaproteobacteria bacterium]